MNNRLLIHLFINEQPFLFFFVITNNALINIFVVVPCTLELVFLWKWNFLVGLVLTLISVICFLLSSQRMLRRVHKQDRSWDLKKEKL